MAQSPTNQRTEREFQLDVNAAVAGTEDEIFQEALGNDPLDNDGDRSLEEMGDGLEGDDLDEEEADETEAEGEGESEEQPEGDEASEETEEEVEGESEDEQNPAEPQDQRGQDQRRQPFVPPSRLREESERRRAAEERAQTLERQLAEVNGRVTELSARVNTAPKPEAKAEVKPPPDMFADPDGYREYLMEEAEKRADAKAQERFTNWQREQQAQREARVNASFTRAANGNRSYEFQAAYSAITKLDAKNPEIFALVNSVIDAPDPGKALFDWWDENGAEEYRAQIAEQLGFVQPQRQGGNTRQAQQQQPRHVTRIPQSLRSQPPSLNEARGSGRQQMIQDPDLYDGSEDSVFRYALK